jgi:hypothetical protein
MAFSHSGRVSLVSRTYACRCGTSFCSSSRSLGSGVSAKLSTTACAAVSSVKSMCRGSL